MFFNPLKCFKAQIFFTVLTGLVLATGLARGEDSKAVANEPTTLTIEQRLSVAQSQIAVLQSQVLALQAQIAIMSTPEGMASVRAIEQVKQSSAKYKKLEAELVKEGCSFNTNQEQVCESPNE